MLGKPNTSNNCELDWSVHRQSKGRCLIASAEQVYYWLRSEGGGIAHRGRSLISMIALFINWKDTR